MTHHGLATSPSGGWTVHLGSCGSLRRHGFIRLTWADQFASLGEVKRRVEDPRTGWRECQRCRPFESVRKAGGFYAVPADSQPQPPSVTT